MLLPRQLLICAPFLAFLSACSLSFPKIISTPPTSIKSGEQLTSIEIILTRASLSDVDFEHFMVGQGHVFKECGKVKRSTFTPVQQRVQILLPQYRKNISERTSRLIEALQSSTLSWSAPGDNRSLTDPGMAKVIITGKEASTTILTSLDAVRSGTQPHENLLKRVVTITRGAAGEMCGNKVFYGVGF